MTEQEYIMHLLAFLTEARLSSSPPTSREDKTGLLWMEQQAKSDYRK